ncbi:PucR family transcriptional regulator [Nocardia salmonicida]|uniref:PucR family transcriptional regulator n=1 Tax=Nocardia salmonicida TaxID=53431 RepID=UPI0007C86E1E|nr:helix-turn-helix domain-containing protein [Nocardia salmonicida]
MATLGELVAHAGLRPLMPEVAERARLEPVHGVCAFDAMSSDEPMSARIVYIRARVWTSLDALAETADALRSAGAVAVLVDDDDRLLPSEFVTACVERALPVLLLPKGVPLERIASGQAHPTAATAIRETVDGFAADSSIKVWLVLQGCVLGSSATDLDLVGKIVARVPETVRGGSNPPAAIHAVLPESGIDLALANPERTQLHPGRFAQLVGDLDTQIKSVEVARSARRESEDALIRELLEAKVASAALEPWARSLGLIPGARVRAVAVVIPTSGTENKLVTALRDLGLHTGGTSVCGKHGNGAYALIIMEDTTTGNATDFDQNLAVLRGLFAHRYGHELSIGTSSCLVGSGDDLVRGLINARHLADRHARSTAPAAPKIALPAPLSTTLLAADPAMAQSLHRVLLQPVLTYDETKGSHYLETLRTFLALDCQWAATANELGIHINTLRYRLTRIERLTGRGIQSMADRVDFYLALSLRESQRRE